MAGPITQFWSEEARTSTGERAAACHLQAAMWAREEGLPATLLREHLERSLELAPERWLVRAIARPLMLHLGETERAAALGRIDKGDLKLAPPPEADDPQKAELLAATALEGAALYYYQLHDARTALELVEQARSVRPKAIAPLAFNVILHDSLSNHAEQAEALEILSGLLEGGQERALTLFAAGRRRSRLGHVDEAATDFRRAIDEDRVLWPALLALSNICEQVGRWEKLALRLDQLANMLSDHHSRARLHWRAGSIYLDRLDQPIYAIKHFCAAASYLPDDPAPLYRLAGIFREQGRVDALISTLERLVPLTWDRPSRAALLTELAGLSYRHHGNREAAAKLCRVALELMHGYLPALQILGSIAQQHGAQEELLPFYLQEAESLAPRATRALRALDAAEIYRRRDQHAAAVTAYRRVIELDPTNHLAFGRLRSLLQSARRTGEVVELLRLQLAAATDPQTRQELEQILKRQKEALLDPAGDEAAIESDLLTFDRDTEEAERLLPRLIARAQQTTDPTEAQWLRIHAAEILFERQSRPLQALDVIAPLLRDDHPPSLATVRMAARILQRSDRWQEVVELFQLLLDHENSGAEAVDLLCRMAEIMEHRLGRPRRAVELYQQALERDPRFLPAFVALERLLSQEQRWDELVTLLQQRAAICIDPLTRASTLSRAAEIADARLGEIDRASRLYEHALADCHDAVYTAESLLRLRLRQGKWNEAEQLLSSPSGKGGAGAGDGKHGHLLLELSWLREDHLGLPADSVLQDAEQLTSDRGGESALLPWELFGLPCCGGWTDRIPDLERLVQIQRNPELCSVLLLDWALRQERSDGGLERAITAVQSARKLLPGDWYAMSALDRLLDRAGRDDELARLREERAERAGDLAADVPALQCHLLCAGAAIGAPSSRKMLRRCLTMDPGYLPALVLAAMRAEAKQQWTERAACCVRISALCSSPVNAVSHAREAVRLWSLLGDESRELTGLLQLLSRAPADHATLARAEFLARKLERYEAVARLYQLRIDSCGEPAVKMELLVECGQLLQHQVQDLEGAIERFTQAAQLAPGDLSTLSVLIEALRADHRWDECALLLRALIDLTDSHDVRYNARITLASILARYLDQPEDATRAVRAAFTERPTEPEALAILVEAHLVNRHTNHALRLVEEFCRTADPHQQLWLLTELADAAARFLKDEHLRFRWDLAALELVVDQPELLDPLVSRYRDLKQLPQLVAIGQTMFELALLPEIQARLELALAQVLLEDLKRPRDALRMVQRTLARQPRHAAARRFCKRIVGGRPTRRREPLDLSYILSLTPAPT